MGVGRGCGCAEDVVLADVVEFVAIGATGFDFRGSGGFVAVVMVEG